MKRLVVVLVVGAGVLLTACLPPADPAKPVKTVQPNPPTPAQGFDACAAPSSTSMNTWWVSSPFTSAGIYIGGANRGCSQPNLTSSWVSTVIGQGWRLLPIWVGPQASCTTLKKTTKLSSSAGLAQAQGVNEATAAANAADALGFTWLAPIYYDMEAYTRGGTCSASVQAFTDGWANTLHSRGYLAGFYSSLCSGVLDQAATYDDPAHFRLDTIWIAAWNNTPNLTGFGAPCALSDTQWTDHMRVHQFKGGHSEAWGGVKMNIDTNAVDGRTYPWP
jgi:Rv2525c-like, glycoside hydrolase-like domain